jgi:predicted ester cyclase
MSETARNLGRRWFEEVWNRGRREAIPEMMTPECLIHDGETDSRGPAAFYVLFDRLHGTFSEIDVRVEDTIAESDRACIRWLFTAKHTGDALGTPPTGKSVRVTGITILREAHGQVVEAWQNWDMLAMMEQIQGSGKKAATYIGAS